MLSRLIRILTAVRSLVAPAIFVIDIDGDRLQVRNGVVPGGLIREFTDVAGDLEIRRGTIRGIQASHGITLSFSREIPAEAHQRFRNILALHRDRIGGAGARSGPS